MTIDSNDLVLLLLGAPTRIPSAQNRIEGVTRLEKLAFLLERDTHFHEKSAHPADHLDFEAYHYGPYTRELYDAVSLLTAIGLVNESVRGKTSRLEQAEELETTDSAEFGLTEAVPYAEKIVELTERGRYIATVLGERIGEQALAEITAIKDSFAGLPLRALLQYVYENHSDMTVNSRIRDAL